MKALVNHVDVFRLNENHMQISIVPIIHQNKTHLKNHSKIPFACLFFSKAIGLCSGVIILVALMAVVMGIFCPGQAPGVFAYGVAMRFAQ